MILAFAAATARAAETSGDGEFAPDSARVVQLRARLRNLGRIRVVARAETFLAEGPVVSSEGLRCRSVTIREGFAYRTLEEPRLFPWAEIESLHGQGHATRNGVLLGALLGGAIGLAIGANQPCHEGFLPAGTTGNCFQRRGAPVLLGTVGGAALGALVAQRSERWQRLYP